MKHEQWKKTNSWFRVIALVGLLGAVWMSPVSAQESFCQVGMSPGGLYLYGRGKKEYIDEAYVDGGGNVQVRQRIENVNKVLVSLTLYYTPFAEPDCGKRTAYVDKLLVEKYGLSDKEILELRAAGVLDGSRKDLIRRILEHKKLPLTDAGLAQAESLLDRDVVARLIRGQDPDSGKSAGTEKVESSGRVARLLGDHFFVGATFGYTANNDGKLEQGGGRAFGISLGFVTQQNYTVSLFFGVFLDPAVKVLAPGFLEGAPFPGAARGSDGDSFAKATAANESILVPTVKTTGRYQAIGLAFTYKFGS